MNKETKETVKKVSEYSGEQKEKIHKKVRIYSIIGLVLMFGGFILRGIPAPHELTYLYNDVLYTCEVLALVLMTYVVLYVNGLLEGMEAKLKNRRVKMATISIIAAVLIACVVIMYCAINL